MRLFTDLRCLLCARLGDARHGRTTIAVLVIIIAGMLAGACGRSDASIADDLRSRLIVDDTTTELELTVTAERGVVRLSGNIPTYGQHARVLEIARDVAGAERVIDETHLNEHPLAAAVRAAVGRDSLVAAVPLEIDATDRGVVVFRSIQTNAQQRARLAQIARGVPGVTGIDDQMK
jgi:osmotically-inducible protein OsmY